MKATELLKTQHQEVDAMFEQIEKAKGEQALPLVEQLVTNLLAHSMIEKEIMYPAVGEAPETSRLHEAYEEHAHVEIAMQKLLSTEASDESFHARVCVLKELVQHHVEEEEKEILVQAERMMDEERLEELGAQMEQRFELLKAGDVRAMLAEQVEQAMPRTPRRRSQSAKQGARRTAARSTSKRGTTQRATKGGRSASGQRTTGRKQSASKGRSTSARSTSGQSTTGRKQSASKGRGGQQSARGAQGRSQTSRSTRKSSGAKGGRRSSTGSR